MLTQMEVLQSYCSACTESKSAGACMQPCMQSCTSAGREAASRACIHAATHAALHVGRQAGRQSLVHVYILACKASRAAA
eukprot:364344-Chlamydomonas_euryale.AAC.3